MHQSVQSVPVCLINFASNMLQRLCHYKRHVYEILYRWDLNITNLVD